MFTALAYENNDSTTLDFFSVAYYPVSDFDITTDMEVDDSRPQPQNHGLYGTPSYRRGMTIDVGGNILADDMDDYVTKRIAMVHALFGNNFSSLVSENEMGMFRVGFSGQTEHWEVAVAVKAFSAPKTWTEGAFSPFLITFFAFQPWFTGVTTPSNKYRWG